MEETFKCRSFFFIAAVDGITTIFEQCRRRFKHIFGAKQGAKRNSFGRSPFAELQKIVDQFDTWEDVVSNGNRQNLIGLSFYDFMHRLDKAVERNTKENSKIKK